MCDAVYDEMESFMDHIECHLQDLLETIKMKDGQLCQIGEIMMRKTYESPIHSALNDVAKLLANGSAAFIWKVHCYWLEALQ